MVGIGVIGLKSIILFNFPILSTLCRNEQGVLFVCNQDSPDYHHKLLPGKTPGEWGRPAERPERKSCLHQPWCPQWWAKRSWISCETATVPGIVSCYCDVRVAYWSVFVCSFFVVTAVRLLYFLYVRCKDVAYKMWSRLDHYIHLEEQFSCQTISWYHYVSKY